MKINSNSKTKSKNLIVITGVPGVGKSTLSKKLSKSKNYTCIDCNEIAINEKCVKGKTKKGELIVNLQKLRTELLKKIKSVSLSNGVIVEGHLACEIKLPASVVLVLRCHPSILRKRLAKREYNTQKINNNLLAELLDYCLVQSEINYKSIPIVSIDNTKPKSIEKIIKQIEYKKSEKVDYSNLLLSKKFKLIE